MFDFKREFEFIRHRRLYYIISALIIVITIGGGLIQGFNFGIDFTGGTMMQIDMGKEVPVSEIKKIINDNDITADIVHAGEGNREIILRTTQSLDSSMRNALLEDLGAQYGITQDNVLAAEQFGPSVGDLLKKNAVRAVLIAVMFMLIYIAVRFEWKFGIAAVIALIHDLLVLIGFYGLFQIPINNPFIASVLVILGYSINDTIVVFDRIRENLKIMKKSRLDELIDKSMNQTLVRSTVTSLTTILAIFILFILGGDTIKQFTLPLIVGILSGTYSSIFIASPVWYQINKFLDKPKYKGK